MSDISIKDAISSLFGVSRPAFKDADNTVNNEEEKKVFKGEDSKETKTKFGQVSSLQEDDKKSSESLSERSKDKVEEDKEISKALQERNEKMAQERMYALNQQNIGLSFSFDDSDNTLVKVTDMNTKKLVRQIPSEEFLEFAEKLDKMIEENKSSLSLDKDEIKGLLLDDKAQFVFILSLLSIQNRYNYGGFIFAYNLDEKRLKENRIPPITNYKYNALRLYK